MLRRLSTAVAALTARARKGARRPLPWLWLMSDTVRLPDPSPLLARLPPGTAVIVRHPDAARRRALAARVLAARRSRAVKVLVAEDWRAAAALGCDGVHLPEAAARAVAPGLRLWRRSARRLLTAAAHDGSALRRARALGADLALLSPVLPTRSHVGRRPLGRLRFARLVRGAGMPVAALGGIVLPRLRALNGTRVAAVAGVGFASDRE
jgi:thiamine-phosphate pyrophosphorylase